MKNLPTSVFYERMDHLQSKLRDLTSTWTDCAAETNERDDIDYDVIDADFDSEHDVSDSNSTSAMAARKVAREESKIADSDCKVARATLSTVQEGASRDPNASASTGVATRAQEATHTL